MGIEMDHDDVAMDDSSADRSDGAGLRLSNTAMTIDPSVVASRILQSTSLQQQKQKETTDAQPNFPQVSALQATGGKSEYRRVRCPPHRYTPLREHWEQILTPLVEYLKLQVRLLARVRKTNLNWDIGNGGETRGRRGRNYTSVREFVLFLDSNPFFQEASIFKEVVGRRHAAV